MPKGRASLSAFFPAVAFRRGLARDDQDTRARLVQQGACGPT